MGLLLRILALLFLAVAAFKGLITISLPIDFLAAGLLLWFLADFLVGRKVA